jgi:hypothetical protein
MKKALECAVNGLSEKFNFKWFNIDSFPEFYDVSIRLDSGQEISAHKCILTSRLEYFKMMFVHTWAEVIFLKF